MSESDIYNDLTLHITPEKFYIEPKGARNLLIIDRASEVFTLQRNSGQIRAVSNRKDFCGFLGTIKLLAGPYLVLATQRELVGYVDSQPIWQLAKAELIPYARSMLHLNPQQAADNAIYVNMIELVLATPHHYFSYSYDLTHSMQRLNDFGADYKKQSMLDRADGRFVWNGHLLADFRRSNYGNFALPIVHGFLSINQCVINGQHFTWTIISRRSVQRSGTRLHRRGIDRDGNVANFVETEQIVEYGGDRASFVQIRGSIPLFWSQTPDLRYKPPPTVHADINPEDHYSACLKHLETSAAIYGKQVLLNLIDHKGAEGRLEQSFKDAIHTLAYPSVRYEAFDFHNECRKMRWDRLSILIDRISLEQDEMGFFMMLRDGSLVGLQEGVFRTNCIDCLDRTNVVQSLLAHRNLEIVLRKLDVLRAQKLEDCQSFEIVFKNVWADNADVVSTQYSGTGALKTDFTRTGKRTKWGLFRDGVNSMTRYYKNNLADGFRQDAIDLFHGTSLILSPLSVDRGWKYITFPSVLLVAVAMFVASAVLPAEYSTESLLYLLFWGSMVAATASTIFRHGKEFVDMPRLTQA